MIEMDSPGEIARSCSNVGGGIAKIIIIHSDLSRRGIGYTQQTSGALISWKGGIWVKRAFFIGHADDEIITLARFIVSCDKVGDVTK
jgi:hypothetical protein